MCDTARGVGRDRLHLTVRRRCADRSGDDNLLTSSISGMTKQSAALVWMRPCDSVTAFALHAVHPPVLRCAHTPSPVRALFARIAERDALETAEPVGRARRSRPAVRFPRGRMRARSERNARPSPPSPALISWMMHRISNVESSRAPRGQLLLPRGTRRRRETIPRRQSGARGLLREAHRQRLGRGCSRGVGRLAHQLRVRQRLDPLRLNLLVAPAVGPRAEFIRRGHDSPLPSFRWSSGAVGREANDTAVELAAHPHLRGARACAVASPNLATRPPVSRIFGCPCRTVAGRARPPGGTKNEPVLLCLVVTV